MQEQLADIKLSKENLYEQFINTRQANSSTMSILFMHMYFTCTLVHHMHIFCHIYTKLQFERVLLLKLNFTPKLVEFFSLSSPQATTEGGL